MATSDTPAMFGSLSELAQGSESNAKRYERLVSTFTEKFGVRPMYIARAPGRVNLIGEHIDYCGYGVLPMALEQDIAMAFTPNDTNLLQISNTSDLYAPIAIDVNKFSIDGVNWHNYFLCGVKGIVEEFKVDKLCGINVVADGNIPPSSGLSSSSALVCCAALVTLCANGLKLPNKKDLANLCARSERFIGTQGGGMDQAISFLGVSGQALMIDFNPLRCIDVNLPEGHCFVIANSGISMNKAATYSFNERVVECRLSAKLIAKRKNLEWSSITKLQEVQVILGVKLKDMIAVVKECLHEEPYTNEEICQLLEIPAGKLVDIVLANMSPQAKEATEKLQKFKLYQRAYHVYTESQRVVEFKDVASSQNGVGISLGKLMSASHVSCRDMYQCSCEQLDELVDTCLQNGALGSRLTGAGWGGCCVSLVEEDCLEMFLDQVASKYYDKPKNELQKSLFATKPGPGAALCTV